MLEAGGTTLVRKKSCSITIRRWTRRILGEMSRFGTFSPNNRGSVDFKDGVELNSGQSGKICLSSYFCRT